MGANQWGQAFECAGGSLWWWWWWWWGGELHLVTDVGLDSGGADNGEDELDHGGHVLVHDRHGRLRQIVEHLKHLLGQAENEGARGSTSQATGRG